MSTEKMAYFAVYGLQVPALPPHSAPAYGGFGFYCDGSLRILYPPPRHAVVIFDDAVLPLRSPADALNRFCEKYQPDTVVFDFEKAAETLSDSICSAVSCGKLLAKPYHPKELLADYLKRNGTAIPSFQPLRCVLSENRWDHEAAAPQNGCYSARHGCMYSTGQSACGTEIHFFDTKQSVLRRAASLGSPSIMPLKSFEMLK